MIGVVSIGLVACSQADPVPLPAPTRKPPAARGRMVSATGFRGYLARPTADGVFPASLQLVPSLDEPSQAAALELAHAGQVILTIEGDVQADAAHKYLRDLPFTDPEVSTLCELKACP